MQAGQDHIGTPFYLIDENNYLALHRRTRACRDEHGRWDTGSGQLEFGLTPEENVLREIEEEYGCTGEIIGALPPHSIIREENGTKTHWLAIAFFVRVRRCDVSLQEPDKHTDLTWATLTTLPEPLHTGFSYTLERYHTRFEQHVRA